MALPLPHNKYVLIGLVGAAIALGLYLRSRNASTDATESSDAQDPMSDLDSAAYDPYSGSYDTSGGGGSNGTGDSQYPYPAGGPPITIRLVPPGTKNGSTSVKRHLYGHDKYGKPIYNKQKWLEHLAWQRNHKGAGSHHPKPGNINQKGGKGGRQQAH